MLHIVLFQPEIPQNTGNIGRMCAYVGARLHLIHPMGFAITDRHLKRSGMDYWRELDVRHHENWPAFRASEGAPERIFLFTTKAKRTYWDVEYREGDAFLFGNEGHGVPDWLRDEIGAERSVTIPRFNDTLRSLNLSTSAGVAAYEYMRQLRPAQL